jgi:hypothetical protein
MMQRAGHTVNVFGYVPEKEEVLCMVQNSSNKERKMRANLLASCTRNFKCPSN